MLQYSSISQSAKIHPRSEIEDPVNFGANVEIHSSSKIGKFSFINTNSVIYSYVEIGRFSSIARGCEVGAASHPTSYLSTHTFQYNARLFDKYPGYAQIKRVSPPTERDKRTYLGSDVWLGAQVVVASGVKIGHGAIVGAGSVVTKDVPPYAIVGGVPAKVIRYRFSDEIIQTLLNLEWWNLEIEQLSGINFCDIEQAIKSLIAIKQTV